MIIFGPAWQGHRLNLNPGVKGIGWWYPHLHPPPSTSVCARRVASTHKGRPPRCVLAALVFTTFVCTCRAGMLPVASTTAVCTCRAGCQHTSVCPCRVGVYHLSVCLPRWNALPPSKTTVIKTTPGEGHAENRACYKTEACCVLFSRFSY